MRRDEHMAGWSMRAQLAIVASVVLAAFAGGAVWLWNADVHRARSDAVNNARFHAQLAADEVARSLARAQTEVASAAGDPDTADAFAAPANCSPSVDEVGVFKTVRLDLVNPDGSVACSSPALPQQLTDPGHVSAPWQTGLDMTDDAVVVAGPVLDEPTGDPSLMVAAPVTLASGQRGVLVLVMAVDDLADDLERFFGGPRNLSFTIVDPASDTVLSDSTRHTPADLPAGPTPYGEPRSGTWEDFRGNRRVHSAVDVPNLHWDIFAGVAEATLRTEVWNRTVRGAETAAIALIAIAVLTWIVNRRIVRPLHGVTKAVDDAGRHPVPSPVKVTGPREIRDLARTFNASLGARLEYEARLTHQALHDPLTELPNRTLIVDRLDHALRRSERDSTHVAVLFVDVDRFKLINDSMGHEAGDRILVALADRLQGALRPSDTVGRFGGDEFVVVTEGLPHREAAVDVARRVQSAFETPFTIDGVTLHLTASIGITASSEPSNDPDTLLREADAAMYQAKENGRGGFDMFDDALRAQAAARLEIETELRAAIERGELGVEYQPLVNTATGDVTGVEALLRWYHPVRGVISPLDFLAVAEETGLIVDIGAFVLDEAVEQLARWHEDGIAVGVSVNVSARQLGRGDLPRHVRDTLARHGIDPGRLTLEVTEHDLVDNRAVLELEALQSQGVRISLDDFGTGYSSLSYLRRLPIDEIKVDSSFIAVLGTDPEAGAIIEAVVAMARSLKMAVVAEGVETVDQYLAVTALGCGSAQGHLLGRPAPALAIRDVFANGSFARLD